MSFSNVPTKYQPKNFEILFEDQDLIIGNKASGALTVSALWNKTDTVHSALNHYVRKGNSKSQKSVYVVHRLDQATSGVLMFAKTEAVQKFIKENWKYTTKTYYAIVHGKLPKKTDILSSYLIEDEDYVVSSTDDSEKGKLAHTEYTVVKETAFFSVLKINLLTGKKNQIRVHLSEIGNPIVGDSKYGKPSKNKELYLHSFAIVFDHPHSKERLRVQAMVPRYFEKLVNYRY
ncbi:MAG: RNA pseudouridine synthase [Bdellovibrionales bacterium RIFCSPHIGHO2_01_FULL_40_29]|nr:MAG: RNA pseudouridine synthase [Bdellovibrionales bacterium RIFCSPHIGHO2_01_FULL_40_29]OFZ33875.1 MAG: RNA pseudouridine synthase [Bdellovibrionales bacterium RIFCSPHIGHO2_02_FULL_40_15]